MKTFTVKLEKPWVDGLHYISEKYVRLARINGYNIRVETPTGVHIVDPNKLMEKGKKMTKEFKFKGNPMTLYGADFAELSQTDKQLTLI